MVSSSDAEAKKYAFPSSDLSKNSKR